MVWPLNDMLEKNNFNCTREAKETFCKLNELLSSAPVLALLDFSKTFIVEVDVSGRCVGVVLMQDPHRIAYINRELSLQK